ncbi:MAG: DUF6600 domain-containing protein [Myxococcales bacterium]
MPRTSKALAAALLAAALLAAALAAGPASADVHPRARPGASAASRAASLALFKDALAPYGEWLELPGSGKVWRPTAVEPDWRPFFHGSWTYTEDGWFWVTDEPWGWATYHYGRWLFHGEHGWVWVPGSTWATAWVTWRWGGGVVGWAPLTADGARWAAFWTFVPESRFVGERVETAAYPAPRVPALLLRTRVTPARSGGAPGTAGASVPRPPQSRAG